MSANLIPLCDDTVQRKKMLASANSVQHQLPMMLVTRNLHSMFRPPNVATIYHPARLQQGMYRKAFDSEVIGLEGLEKNTKI